MNLSSADRNQLQQLEQQLSADYQAFTQRNLSLDLTRGKPAAEQLNLSDSIDGILKGDYKATDGTDTRNYGGLYGLPELRKLGADMLDVNPNEIMVGGNSSLTYMYFTVLFGKLFGLGNAPAWGEGAKFICPTPGYDRHFAICEALGIEMVNVGMDGHGPDMDAVEQLVSNDPAIKGMWNVPKYSNPTGITYGDETVKRIAALGKIAAPGFVVLWDNAYAVHDLGEQSDPLLSVMDACREAGTENSAIQFTSTSKITHAGSGVCFVGASKAILDSLAHHLGSAMIGPDKVNQLRHARLFPDMAALQIHMQKHAGLLAPRFDVVEEKLSTAFAESDMLSWTKPNGGYFVSVHTRPGVAAEVVKLSNQAGVKLTPAGATFPYGKDPRDSNIRLAPSFASLADIEQAMDVFCCCVKLATVRQALAD